ncbi:hypothetical protein ACLOJK_022788, partial [Asimina triloba]
HSNAAADGGRRTVAEASTRAVGVIFPASNAERTRSSGIRRLSPSNVAAVVFLESSEIYCWLTTVDDAAVEIRRVGSGETSDADRNLDGFCLVGRRCCRRRKTPLLLLPVGKMGLLPPNVDDFAAVDRGGQTRGGRTDADDDGDCLLAIGAGTAAENPVDVAAGRWMPTTSRWTLMQIAGGW